MPYSLNWRTPALPYTQKQSPISVPAGSVVTNAASIKFTGKGAANYGKVQQENMMQMLENFAGPFPPDNATVGQTWYDSTSGILKVCAATAPSTMVWRSLNGTQVTDVGDPAPAPPVLGDTWFQRTGTASGVMYAYTGVGRYPQKDWNAATAGYFPVTSTTLGIKINYSTFSTQNWNEAYICSLSSGSLVDADGTILINGTATSVPRGQMYTQFPSADGLIVWDRTGTLVSTATPASSFYSVRQLPDGTWQYDNNSVWTAFEPSADMYVIGTVQVAEQDDQSSPGITSAVIFSEALDLRKMTQVPAVLAGGAIGGWEQIYPPVGVAAGREEYDYVMSLVSQLIGDATTFGGSGAMGKSTLIQLPALNSLDASLQLAWKALIPHDQAVVYDEGLLNKLKVDVNSNDWDRLLASIKYAANRLELPVGITDDVSDLPFVQDGRLPPSFLLNINPVATPDMAAMKPSDRRQLNRHCPIGHVTLARLYQETLNVVYAAQLNRYMLKGMQGTSGVNKNFNSNVAVSEHVSFTASAAGSMFTNAVTQSISFNFDTTDVDQQRFFTAGQAIEVIVRSSPSAPPTKTAADTNFANLCSQFGRFRITQDAVYVMDNSAIPAMTQIRSEGGYASCTTAGVTLASGTVGAASIVLRGQTMSMGQVHFHLDVKAGGATTGTISVAWNLITDNEMYDNGTKRVYPKPLAYQLADQVNGSAWFGNGTTSPSTTQPTSPSTPSPTIGITGDVTLTVATSETVDAGLKLSGIGFRNDGYIYTVKANSGAGASATTVVDNTAGNWYIGKPITTTQAGAYEVKFEVVSGTADQSDASKVVTTGSTAVGTWYNLGTSREFGRQIWLKQAGTSANTTLVFKATIRDVATKTVQSSGTFTVNWTATRT